MTRETFQVPAAVATAIKRMRSARTRVEDAMLPPMEDVDDALGYEWHPVLDAFDAVDESINNLLRAYVTARREVEAKLGAPLQ